MDVIKYIFYMGVIQIVFSTLWKFIATLASSLFQRIGLNKDLSFLGFKAAGYYILVSVSALVTWDMMVKGSTVTAALVGIAGTFIIYTTIAGNLERNRWRAVMNFERKRVQVMRFDGYLLISSVALFLVTLALPEIADNPVNNGFRTFIDNVYKTPVIGWIVGLGALFYMLHIIFKGMRTTDYLINLLFYPNRVRRGSAAMAGQEDDTEFVDYEEVHEDESQR
jgi:hypothetical protein